MYPGYQRFFSRAVGIFGVGRRPTHARKVSGTQGNFHVGQFSDPSIKDRIFVSDSSKPTFASIGKLTVMSPPNLTRRFLLVLIALISLITIEKRISPRAVQ